jgi:hypothetical protein
MVGEGVWSINSHPPSSVTVVVVVSGGSVGMVVVLMVSLGGGTGVDMMDVIEGTSINCNSLRIL